MIMKIITWTMISVLGFMFIWTSVIGGGYLLHTIIPAMSMFACTVMFTIIAIGAAFILLLLIINTESAEM